MNFDLLRAESAVNPDALAVIGQLAVKGSLARRNHPFLFGAEITGSKFPDAVKIDFGRQFAIEGQRSHSKSA